MLKFLELGTIVCSLVPGTSWTCESLEIFRAEVEALWSYKGMSVQLFEVSHPAALVSSNMRAVEAFLPPLVIKGTS